MCVCIGKCAAAQLTGLGGPFGEARRLLEEVGHGGLADLQVVCPVGLRRQKDQAVMLAGSMKGADYWLLWLEAAVMHVGTRPGAQYRQEKYFLFKSEANN